MIDWILTHKAAIWASAVTTYHYVSVSGGLKSIWLKFWNGKPTVSNNATVQPTGISPSGLGFEEEKVHAILPPNPSTEIKNT